MNKLDRIKNVLNNEVLEYLEACDCYESYFSEETNISFEEDGIEYDALVAIEARFNLTKEYETDDYGNRYYMGTSKDLKNYQFEIIDLYDFENECYLIEGRKISKELQ